MIRQFKTAVQLGGDVALATFDLAQTYLKLGRTEDAILGFRRTIELDPTHYRARTNLGLLLKNQGKIPEAIEQLRARLNSPQHRSSLSTTWGLPTKLTRTLTGL
jgi:tetratricopeptide (TPR) repeat protein